MPAHRENRLLPGTLDMLVLKALQGQRLHGLAIAERIHEITSGRINVRQGSLLPCLKRLHRAGHLRWRWGQSTKTNRLVQLHCWQPGAGSHLRMLIKKWAAVSDAINAAVRL
jgi:hypothetical protein